MFTKQTKNKCFKAVALSLTNFWCFEWVLRMKNLKSHRRSKTLNARSGSKTWQVFHWKSSRKVSDLCRRSEIFTFYHFSKNKFSKVIVDLRCLTDIQVWCVSMIDNWLFDGKQCSKVWWYKIYMSNNRNHAALLIKVIVE
jgi:hypothetical protein